MKNYELEDETPYKKKKHKQTPKKSDHKHIYGKYIIKEELHHISYIGNTIRYNVYKKCNICGKLELTHLPQNVKDEVTKKFNKNPHEFEYWLFLLQNREEVEFVKNNFPEIIGEVIYLEK